MARKHLDDSWSRVKLRIRHIWNVELEDEELKKARGSLARMVSLIEQKTGESREQIAQKMQAVF